MDPGCRQLHRVGRCFWRARQQPVPQRVAKPAQRTRTSSSGCCRSTTLVFGARVAELCRAILVLLSLHLRERRKEARCSGMDQNRTARRDLRHMGTLDTTANRADVAPIAKSGGSSSGGSSSSASSGSRRQTDRGRYRLQARLDPAALSRCEQDSYRNSQNRLLCRCSSIVSLDVMLCA